jgi:trehalose-phosphatase
VDYSDTLIDHCNSPRNVGAFPRDEPGVATGVARDEVCGDVIRLQIRIDPGTRVIRDARFKTFGCAPAIAAASLVTEWLKGRTVDEAARIESVAIASALSLPPHKLHCATLAAAAIRRALEGSGLALPHASRPDPRGIVEPVLAAILDGSAGKRLLLCCDYDGTLVEFASNPQAVGLDEKRRHLLTILAAKPDLTLAIVSGRRLADLKARVGVADACYAGLHGFEVECGGRRLMHPEAAAARGLLQVLARSLRAHVADLDGVLVENKDLSVALHVRAASPESRERAEAIFRRMSTPHLESGSLKLMRGSCVFELMPNVDCGKGDAVRLLRRTLEQDGHPVWPVYIGDHVTDADAVHAVEPDGIAIAVGDRAASAEWRLGTPAAVEALLARLARSWPDRR